MKRIKQKDIAKFLGISPGYLSEIFSGVKRLSPKNAKRISDLLKISPVVLLFGSPKDVKATILNAIRYKLTV
jgi:transcriptional regulator with XRE-family HTH domain